MIQAVASMALARPQWILHAALQCYFTAPFDVSLLLSSEQGKLLQDILLVWYGAA